MAEAAYKERQKGDNWESLFFKIQVDVLFSGMS